MAIARDTFVGNTRIFTPTNTFLSSTAKHRGEFLKKKVKEQGKKVVGLAAFLDVHRSYVYTLYSKPDLEWHWLKRAGDYLRYDFSQDFPDVDRELVATDLENAPAGYISLEMHYQEVNEWKDKYITLLEKWQEFTIAPTKNGNSAN